MELQQLFRKGRLHIAFRIAVMGVGDLMRSYALTTAKIRLELLRWLLEFYILEISSIISGRVLFCSRAHIWMLYSVAQLGDYATSPLN